MVKALGPVGLFLLLLIVLTAIAGSLMIATHGSVGGMLYLVFYEWTPGLAAMLASLLYSEGPAWPVFQGLSARRVMLSYALPLVYIVPVYVVTWMVISGSWQPFVYMMKSARTMAFPLHPALATFAIFVPMSLTLGLLTRFPYTAGEELGWRGYLFPALLRRHGFVRASLLTGLSWACWHYPLLYAFGLFSTPDARARIMCFTVMVLGLSLIFGWLWMRTRSLAACILMHASHNAFLQTFFDPMTGAAEKTRRVTSEFGFGLMLMVWLVALILTVQQRRNRRGAGACELNAAA